MPILQPDGRSVQVGNVTLRTPGLAGVAEPRYPGAPDTRASEQTTPTLDAALANERVEPQETVEIAAAAEVDMGNVATRSTAGGEPAIELEVPDPGEEWGQFVLHADEAGVLSWNFARDIDNRVDATRGIGGSRTYVIRRTVPPVPETTGESRGLMGAVGTKLLKVLAFPIIDPVLGKVGDYFAGRWEAQKRPYRFRTFTADDHSSSEGRPLDASDWTSLGKGRALLMVHGTLSRAHTAFGALPAAFVKALHDAYDGRVFAFDHFTLSHDPNENVRWFVDHLPEKARLELDIICHSRGGLVSRVLAEKQGELSLGSRTVAVKRVVFVATPNAGTVLADTAYVNDFIDAYTNLLNFLPDTGALEVMEGLITIAKQIAVGALKGLDGLQSMNPKGKFLSTLNTGPKSSAQYFAMTADFEPTAPGFRDYVTDLFTDKIFKTENDLVVPTAGVYDTNGSDGFPIIDRRAFGVADGIAHTRFFGHPAAQQQIMQWLA
jgi:hypothetical protein